MAQNKVLALRKASMEAPLPPDAAEKARLGACTLCVQPGHTQPPWLATLCVHRDVFQDIALVINREGRERVFQFLSAKQSPYMAAFSPAHNVGDAAPCCLYECSGFGRHGILGDDLIGRNEVVDAIDSNIVDGRHVLGGHKYS